ncbi:hypothetical protein [Agromyces marinus]|uniref:Uncharacterized protein n=1 Tax=Agromyces marinus TaxID=1389020 RepID=A0ABN6YAT3_9MICO|nr:hypothetical protein [Agromyces marinus]UIP57421.1 hypothetical protein DSM26151_02760 [Agromyces marinus]BDZ54457.1 hypothetical protein GCM10025870_15300 [Agromyces marinus]
MSATVSGPSTHEGEPTAAELLAAGDIVGLMRACHDRRLEREGIPMVIGLADERGAVPTAGSEAQLAEGRAYADVFERYSAALVPWARNDDEGAVITAMQVVAYTHFAPGAAPVTDAANDSEGTPE